MHLKKLSLVNFKNCQEAELILSPKVNCFVGDNGEGKTNLLDAIYYLSFCKSFFNPIDSQNILHGEDFLVIQGEFEKQGKSELVDCGVKRNKKKQFRRNKKDYKRLADHIGLLPLVMVSPADTNLIYEGSEARRRFVDGVIAQHDKLYLDHLLHYQKALSQRNALLKQFAESGRFDEASLEVWDAHLIDHGTKIFDARKEFLENFIPVFQKHFEHISGGKELVGLEYVSKMLDNDLGNLLQSSRNKDRALQYTSVGIHKDDLLFLLGEHPIKKFGSQGQQKTYLTALKLAQFAYISEKKEVKPLLLLDDIFDKLDDNRVAALMELVGRDDFGQIFVTDTNADRVEQLFEDKGIEFQLFKVKAGQVEALETSET